jgi:hypothetical protein
MKAYRGSKEIDSIILSLWRSIAVVNFTPVVALPPGMKPGTHRAGAWRGTRICMDTLEKRKCTAPGEILAPTYPARNLVANIQHV